jgi:hypothetical protein
MRAKQEEKNGFDGDSILHVIIFGFCIIVVFFILVFAEVVVFIVVFKITLAATKDSAVAFFMAVSTRSSVSFC